MIYIAAPYSHPDPEVVKQRVQQTNAYAAYLIRLIDIVYSPITMSHPLTVFGLRGDWETWRHQDTYYLHLCTEFHVLQLPGWEDSEGIKSELYYAKSLDKKIRYVKIEFSGFIIINIGWEPLP